MKPGYYIRHTRKVPRIGETLHAETYDIFPTREADEAALPEPRERDLYTYEVAEVRMRGDG